MMLSKANCRNVEAINVDFLTVEPSDPKYSAATHMYVHGKRAATILWKLFIFWAYSLLDPSCSGSGIVNRLDHLLVIGECL